MKLVDYSWARPSPQSIVDAGYAGAMRYLGSGNGGRDLTVAEAESLQAHGLGVGLVWESTANRALGGYDAGRYDGDQADYYASLLGWPGLPIYFACDVDVTDAQAYGVVLDYYRGTLSCASPPRPYGEAAVIDACATELGMLHGWQAGAMGWSGYRTSVHAGMLQSAYYVMDNQCDENHVLIPDDLVDWLWGDHMPLSQSDLNAIRNVTYEVVNDTLSKMYTGSRILAVEGRPEIWELIYDEGQLVARYIPTPAECNALQYLDHVAGRRGDPPRMLTDPADIEWFDTLRRVGYPGAEAAKATYGNEPWARQSA